MRYVEFFEMLRSENAKYMVTGLAVLLLTSLGNEAAGQSAGREQCLAEMLVSAPDDMTVGELREACRTRYPVQEQEIAVIAKEDEIDEQKAVEVRTHAERNNILKPFTIMAHRPNYILFAANNFHGYSAEEFREAQQDDGIDLDNFETQFQLSFKTPLALNLFDTSIGIWGAYTARSFWQAFNTDLSSPFRETNHEPEIWLQMQPDLNLLGFRTAAVSLGIAHQSNGQGGNLSRSWNRIYGSIVLERRNLALAFKPWIRIQEDIEDDDNPNITDYLGHGELRLAYKYKDHTFSLMSRNNLESGFSRGAAVLGWSFPLFGYPYLKGYLQYFSGYGESLIDYDRYVNRLGFGLLLTDIL